MTTTVAEGRDEMDKQTAIDLLDNLLGMVEDNHDSDYDVALHMGIDALKMQLSIESTTFPVDGEPLDCISRQQAILAIERNAYRREDINETEHIIKWVLDIIKWLPSVHPEIIRCKDCKNWQIDWESANAPKEHFCAMVDGFHYGDWYCADASRRSGAEIGEQDE